MLAISPRWRLGAPRSFGPCARRRSRAACAMPTLWDGLQKGQPVRVSEEEIAAAWRLDSGRDTQSALKQRCGQHPPLLPSGRCRVRGRKKIAGGALGQMVRPLESVGCYVPGGRYPLPSTVLMTVIPAQVAGVKRIGVVSPRPAGGNAGGRSAARDSRGLPHGGAQAIAALPTAPRRFRAWTRSSARAIAYVTAAKKMVGFDCAIDMLAGPTEAVIVSDDGNPPSSWRRPGGAGRARSGCAGRLCHDESRDWRRR